MEQSTSQKLVVGDMVKKFPAFDGNQTLIAVFTRAHH